MAILTHAVVGSNDLAAATKFYDAALGALGISNLGAFGDRMIAYGDGGPGFLVSTPYDGEPACRANGGTIGFAAKTAAEVAAFHAAGLAAGGTCDGPPGARALPNSYGAYLRDPEGNKICAFSFDQA